ncbi:MAG TPA: TonB-dependent receptor [Prolixibacteraceae bacterium]|nr:TonB-dependent receptor [Prolixibacteraceae bacterium]
MTVLLLILFVNLSAQKHTLFGYIKDKASGESLIGATLSVNDKSIGTISNNYGFYSIAIPAGKQRIKCSYIGYQAFSKEIELISETNLNIDLEAKDSKLQEVVITASKNNKVTNNEMGSQSLSILAIKQMPAVMGESDLVKSLQLLPGIQATNEGTTNLSVRGGSFDQNLFLLDDAPVYNPSHALGFFSVFNTDAIKSVKVYKASFPAQYGGRLSSIVDIHMKEGNSKELSASGGMGLIASRLTLEGPITKDKASFIVSGRYSYAGLTANGAGLLGQSLGIKGLRDFNAHNEINFYDLNAKVNYKVNDKNHLFLSAYTGSDHFFYYAIDDNSSMDWGNITGTARWNHIFNSKLFANTMLIYSKYDYSYILKDDARHFKWLANLQEMDVKTDFDYFLNPNNSLKFGISLENHHYFPGKVEPRDATSITKPFTLDKQRAVITTAYLNNEQRISDKIGLDYGLRYSAFFLLGESTVYSYSPEMEKIDSVSYSSGELVKFYQSLEPRFSFRYQLTENSSIKLSWSKTVQFQHLIGNSTVGLPSDVWIPASMYIKPQSANQIAIGYYRMLAHNQFECSIEAYYRRMYHIIDYRDNADLFLNPHVETQVLSGDGHSYGLEFYLEKKVGRMTGWLSYTLSKTDRQIDGINNNQAYPASYDKRHNLSLLLNYKLSATWSASSIFKFTSGGFATIPEGTFNYYGAAFNYYTNRNGYKLPSYHRLDLSFNYQSRKNENRSWKTEWNFGIYNVYDRKNIFALFIKQDNDQLYSSRAYKMYLYGITPFATFNFKF